MIRHAVAAALLAGVGAAPLAAQVGLTTDVLTGVVTLADGSPLAGVEIEALSLETQITRRAATDRNGRYAIVFPDGGGQYRVIARLLGMQPQQTVLQRYADEDRLVWNVRLEPAALMLDPITVEAGPRPVRMPDPPTPGSIERLLTPDFLARLPIDEIDLNVLATLVPGVVAVDETDSSAAAFSVAGLRPDANALTLDGLIFGSGSVPQDGLRATRVMTSTYDVARGQFSGGLIASTTRGGTNQFQLSSRYSLRDDALAFSDTDESPFAQGVVQHQLSGGAGGPLVRDRLLLFVSGQTRLRTNAATDLLSATADDLLRLGVHPDSVARFVGIVGGLGIAEAGGAVSGDRSSTNHSLLARLDWILTGAHTLTLRGDWRGGGQEPTRVAPLALPQTGGTLDNGGGGVMTSLTSRLGVSVINEVRAYWARSSRATDPFVALPAGRVAVLSELPDGATGAASLSFGGNAGMPDQSHGTSLEVTDEVSWIPGRGRHRFKVGGLFRTEVSDAVSGAGTTGAWTYRSLADLEAGMASSFGRTMAAPERRALTRAWAVYAGDVWRASRALQVTAGLRLEGGRLAETPAYNARVDSAFGRRTDLLPGETHLSPRAGFTWTLGARPAGPGVFGQPRWIVRGGAGEFRSPVPLPLLTTVQAQTGLGATEARLLCVGPGVPAPTWSDYLTDPAAVPDACLAAGPVFGAIATPTVALFADGFTAPRAWRASLGVQRTLGALLRLHLDLTYSRGVSQYGFRDLNLDATPAFTLDGEGGRPVFVPPAAISPATGAVSFTPSRLDPDLGHVFEITSDLASESKQLTTGVSGVLRRGAILQASYTLTSARDEASAARFGARGGFAGATTAGDPNAREWARSDFERRHAFLVTLTWPFATTLELTTIARLTSGAPYTPMVSSDINGDGVANDRAFVVDPASDAAMQRFLASASGGARRCLERQANTVAARNSCTGPWQSSFDLQLNWRPALFGLERRLTVSLLTMNLLRGVDELLHGAAGAKGWGLARRPDATLLTVTGFDAAAERYAYALNERFGATGAGASAFRQPFQLGIQARLSLGPDRGRDALDRLRGGAGRAGAPAARRDFAQRFAQFAANAAARVLALDDSLALGLDERQRAGLEAERDTLDRRFEVLADSARGLVEGAAARGEPGRVVEQVRPLVAEAREAAREALRRIRDLLTAEQWGKLPESVRRVGPPPR